MMLPVEKILERISSYELLNNILPGAVYVTAVDWLTPFGILSSDVFRNLILCYSFGLVISRLGSVVIEELLRRIKKGRWLNRAPYADYVVAEANDPSGKLRELSMVNNAYRSFLATAVCIFLTIILQPLWPLICDSEFAKYCVESVALLAVIAILCFSYRKQTKYVRKRVEINKKQQNERRKD